MRYRKYLYYGASLFVLFAIYYATGKLGLGLDPVNRFATLFWLPTGISLSALLIFGYRMWPAIFLGAFFVNFTTGAPLFVALGIAAGNTLEAFVASYILNQFFGFRHSLERTKDVLSLTLIAGPLSVLVSATMGVASLWFGNLISPSSFFTTGGAWFVGDLLSDIVIAPFLLVWSSKYRFSFPTPKRIAEGIIVVLFFVLCCLFIFTHFLDIRERNLPVTYVIFPPFIWIALRFGPRATISAIFTLLLIAVWSTAHGFGPFVTARLQENLVSLQSFMGVVALTSMVLAAVGSERRQLEKRKDDFIITASHELKTPITSIKAFTQLLKKIFKQREERQAVTFLNSMERQIDKLTYLINDLLDLSKIQSEQLELKKEAFSLYQLLQETVESMQATTKKHMIIIKGKVSKTVYGDRDRISQVLNNLLSNAIKYSPESKKIIARIWSDNKTVVVSIQDFGVGIPRHMQQQVFERFFRVQNKGTNHVSGVGLGLYISSEIIKQHKGKIWVESARGRGATFFFTLPLAKVRVSKRLSLSLLRQRVGRKRN